MSCVNRLKIQGNADLVSYFVKKAKGKPVHYKLSAQEIEMYEGLDELEAIQQEPEEQLFCCGSFVPVPAEVVEKGYHEAGYDFQVRQWGIPHEAFFVTLEQADPETAVFTFYSDDVPPMNALQQIAEMFPALKFDLLAIAPDEETTYKSAWRAGRQVRDEVDDLTDEDREYLRSLIAVDDLSTVLLCQACAQARNLTLADREGGQLESSMCPSCGKEAHLGEYPNAAAAVSGADCPPGSTVEPE